jgi:adenosylhomocysteine nucleosidase
MADPSFHSNKSLGAAVLVCFAVCEEARPFARTTLPASVKVLITGIARKNAARAVERELKDFKPELVLTCGFAGGLRPDLSIGTVVYDEDEGAGLGSILQELGAVPARFLCSPHIVVRAEEKRQLRANTGADAVEMESEVIRQICRERQVRSATIRVISDALNDDLPLDFNVLANDDWELQYHKLARALLRSPGRIPALLRLQRHTRQAAQNLGHALRQLLLWKGALTG